MRKKLFHLLFACILLLPYAHACVSVHEPFPAQCEDCNVPPPDSFRVLNKSTNFITLAWHPISSGSTHYLNVFEKNQLGQFELVFAFPSLQGHEFKVDNLSSGEEYKFEIFTNCNSGGPSIQGRSIFDGTLILELTTNGRVPVNPYQIECNGIPFEDYAWVGYQVDAYDRNGVLIVSNLYEFNFCGPITGPNYQACIKRVILENPILATTDDGTWPVSPNEPLGVQSPFRMGHKLYENSNYTLTIGRISLIVSANKIIFLCNDVNNSEDPWKLNYEFKALAADQAMEIVSPNEGRNWNENSEVNNFSVNSIFHDNIYLRCSNSAKKDILFSLINPYGEVEISEYLGSGNNEFLIPSSNISPGFYVMIVNIDGISFHKKVFKI